jgi:hypothetical protein
VARHVLDPVADDDIHRAVTGRKKNDLLKDHALVGTLGLRKASDSHRLVGADLPGDRSGAEGGLHRYAAWNRAPVRSKVRVRLVSESERSASVESGVGPAKKRTEPTKATGGPWARNPISR